MKDFVCKDMHSLRPKIIHVGDYSYGYDHTRIAFAEEADLYIGKFCSIGYGFSIFLGGNHKIRRVSTYPFGGQYKDIFTNFPLIAMNTGKEFGTTNGDIVIGNDVYIGANVTIMSGVKVGDGSVISANSVVYSNVKSYSVVGGNPTIFWFFRFSSEIIKKLLEMKWWDWSVYDINRALPFICSDDPEKLIKFYETKIVGETKL